MVALQEHCTSHGDMQCNYNAPLRQANLSWFPNLQVLVAVFLYHAGHNFLLWSSICILVWLTMWRQNHVQYETGRYCREILCWGHHAFFSTSTVLIVCLRCLWTVTRKFHWKQNIKYVSSPGTCHWWVCHSEAPDFPGVALRTCYTAWYTWSGRIPSCRSVNPYEPWMPTILLLVTGHWNMNQNSFTNKSMKPKIVCALALDNF